LNRDTYGKFLRRIRTGVLGRRFDSATMNDLGGNAYETN